MPRPPRDSAPGIHHIVVKATGPSAYFLDDTDRIDWIRRFVRVLAQYEWVCVAVCLMTTHVHALIDVKDESLSTGMRDLNTAYGKRFNDAHGREGYLLGRRFWSKRMKDEAQLVATFRYVMRNPVRAHLTARAEDWFWSSLATSCELKRTFPFADASYVLAALGKLRTETPAQVLLPLVR